MIEVRGWRRVRAFTNGIGTGSGGSPMEYKISSDFTIERRLAVTPDAAGWKGLTFRTYMFRAGHPIDGESVDDEVLMLFLGGSATVRVGEQTWDVDGRDDVFSGPPHCIYLPPRHSYLLTPRTDCEVAYARARAEGRFAPRFIPPRDQRQGGQARGGDGQRVTTLLGPGEAERLLCAEAWTPAGSWGDCPLYEHEEVELAARRGADLAEVCYHRIKPKAGWAIQRLYADGGTDAAVVVRQGDAVMVRGESHPVVAAPGHALYTLHVLADES